MPVGLISAVLNGICMGSIYGLIAIGLTLIFGIMRIINFAHGALLMLSMLLSYWLWSLVGTNPYLLLVAVVPVMFGLGYTCERLLIKPVLERAVEEREPIGVLLLTAGMAVAMENLVLMVFGADYVLAQTSFSDKTVTLGGVSVGAGRFYAMLVALAVVAAFSLYLNRSELGRGLRATGQDRYAAALMGIDVGHMYAIAFGVGTALTAVAGTALIPFYYAHATVGQVFMTKAFVVVVLGGLGSVPGALLGGLIIGFIESVAAQYMTAAATAALVYFSFVVLLLVKPSGLLGSPYEW